MPRKRLRKGYGYRRLNGQEFRGGDIIDLTDEEYAARHWIFDDPPEEKAEVKEVKEEPLAEKESKPEPVTEDLDEDSGIKNAAILKTNKKRAIRRSGR